MQTTVGWILRKFEANGNLDVEMGTPEWRQAARTLALAEFESLKRTARWSSGLFANLQRFERRARAQAVSSANAAR